jgi:predicted DNA-binding ribbon-helix-helix protein
MHRVRTTITISEQLYREAKARAAQSSLTVSQLIEDAVREALRPKPAESALVSDLPVFGGSGVLPGVDLSNAAALLDEMDRGEGLDALR